MVSENQLLLDAQRERDESFMIEALEQAQLAYQNDEVPVGAVLVVDNKIIARACNTKEKEKSPLGHAEINVIVKAKEHFSSWRYLNSTLYVTLEPCLMCAGAIIQARVGRVVYGTPDPKGGACVSLYQFFSDERLNHRPNLSGPILQEPCSKILKDFFVQKRTKA